MKNFKILETKIFASIIQGYFEGLSLEYETCFYHVPFSTRALYRGGSLTMFSVRGIIINLKKHLHCVCSFFIADRSCYYCLWLSNVVYVFSRTNRRCNVIWILVCIIKSWKTSRFLWLIRIVIHRVVVVVVMLGLLCPYYLVELVWNVLNLWPVFLESWLEVGTL